MSIKKTLGGDRLGSGKKMQVDLHNFARSSHDLGRIWRSTMSAGTLVPYMVEYALPGDVWNIDLDADVKTYPTVGPLFGSFKLQIDIFQAPIRLYNAQLHNNALGIGMNMSKIKLPQLKFEWLPDNEQPEGLQKHFYGKHINDSSIHAYLGIRGLGRSHFENGSAEAYFNAVPYVAYWDIYKNYYANKQEEIGYVISGTYGSLYRADYKAMRDNEIITIGRTSQYDEINFAELLDWEHNDYLIKLDILGTSLRADNIEVFSDDANDWLPLNNLLEYDAVITENENGINISFEENTVQANGLTNIRLIEYERNKEAINLKKFELSNIDDMRNAILQKDGSSPMIIDKNSSAPYGESLKGTTYRDYKIGEEIIGDLSTINSMFSQEGLGIKTYQSDIFNNWLSTDWIDGTNGINEITAVDTSDGSFNIDTLNLANKVYNMLNRIAVSGGSYDDWIEANWSHESYRRTESPIYHGGLSKEIVFQEVISNAETEIGEENKPLGSLAGKGGLSNKKKGGKVTIKVHEPSVIIGIVSITPRIDYSQGNEWHINLETLDDFHKPGLDQIGFQELITEQMASWDVIRKDNGVIERKSAGKQPAWINYMTSFNRTYGYFADPDKEMYMTLNRRYEYSEEGIKDLTTYIDPSKFNYLFAVQELSAQNFWVQIGADITARRKMSAKVMPNL